MAAEINDFVEDILKPTVVTFDYHSFYRVVAKKPVGKVWLIDFFASWCGPCQQLAPEWRKLAKKLAGMHKFDVVQVAQVDCQQEQALCAEQHVQSFPNIRIYPADTYGVERFEIFQGWMRDLNSLFQWSQEYLPSKVANLNQNSFEKQVLRGDKQSQPWVVDFYAPWCGHCQIFAPIFEQLAERLDGQVQFGKVNCQLNQYVCQMAGIQAFPTIRFYSNLHRSSQYNIGEELQLNYELNFLLNQLNSKLKQHGYEKKSATQPKNTEL
jgi:DnaJ family protein C protein 10